MKRKKRAFTLTELLVVVIVIASLSAIIVPKYQKVLETKKTGEADAIMRAVRTEQERRCTIGKPYTTLAHMSDLVPQTSTKNFSYSDGADGQSLIATSSGKYKYKLQMLSFRDGRVCCTDVTAGDCDKLNKNYPKCSEIEGSLATAPECVPDMEVITDGNGGCTPWETTHVVETRSCEGGKSGTQMRTKTTSYSCVNNQMKESVSYTDWEGECSPTCASEYPNYPLGDLSKGVSGHAYSGYYPRTDHNSVGCHKEVTNTISCESAASYLGNSNTQGSGATATSWYFPQADHPIVAIDASACSANTCEPKTETEHVSCAEADSRFSFEPCTSNGAYRTKKVNADCSEEYGDWDLSACYQITQNTSSGETYDETACKFVQYNGQPSTGNSRYPLESGFQPKCAYARWAVDVLEGVNIAPTYRCFTCGKCSGDTQKSCTWTRDENSDMRFDYGPVGEYDWRNGYKYYEQGNSSLYSYYSLSSAQVCSTLPDAGGQTNPTGVFTTEGPFVSLQGTACSESEEGNFRWFAIGPNAQNQGECRAVRCICTNVQGSGL